MTMAHPDESGALRGGAPPRAILALHGHQPHHLAVDPQLKEEIEPRVRAARAKLSITT
ncbi:MAG: hypothetical protein IH999_09605 [Proteobacteria bacterium]|nr:hypothetical protein [Pseudomonadota bacterium]